MSSPGPKTLLQIVNQVQGVQSLPQSASVIGNTDPTTLQLLNLLIDLTTELRRLKRWTSMQAEYIIEALPGTTFTGNIGDLQPTKLAVIDNISPATTGLLFPYLSVVQVPSIPTPCRVVSVDSSTQITVSMQASAAANSVMFTGVQDTYTIPGDFDFYQNRSMWDRTNRWELLGPDSPQMNQWLNSGIVATGPRRHFRQLGPFSGSGVFRIWPPPFETVANLQMVFEYASTLCVFKGGVNTVPSSGGYVNASNLSSTWTSDTDTPVLDDDLLIKGLRWKFWEAKGFNYTNLKNDWLDYVDQQYARDGARKSLQLIKRINPIFLSPANVQDGFFPGPVSSS
jgi:hypothetical protein